MDKLFFGLIFALVITGAIVGSAQALGWFDINSPAGMLIGGVIGGIVALFIVNKL